MTGFFPSPPLTILSLFLCVFISVSLRVSVCLSRLFLLFVICPDHPILAFSSPETLTHIIPSQLHSSLLSLSLSLPLSLSLSLSFSLSPSLPLSLSPSASLLLSLSRAPSRTRPLSLSPPATSLSLSAHLDPPLSTSLPLSLSIPLSLPPSFYLS